MAYHESDARGRRSIPSFGTSSGMPLLSGYLQGHSKYREEYQVTFGKRQLLIGALVVALGAAVYLNWQFSSGTSRVEVSETAAQTKELGQTVYVNTEVSGQVKKTASQSSQQDSGSAQSSSQKETSDTKQSFDDPFYEERQKRQSARDEALSALEGIAEAVNSSESARTEAVKAVEKLSLTIKSESDMETEIKSKGFSDCFVSVNNENCSVIVPQEGLDEAAAVTIKDIVNRQSGIGFDKITISGRKTA